MVTKSDTIAEIMRLNPSADAEFLSGFAIEALRDYLVRLRSVPRIQQILDESTMRPGMSAIAGAA